MAQPGKKSANLHILSDIYHEQGAESTGTRPERRSIIEKIKQHFNDPKTVEKWLSGAVLFFGIAGIIFGFGHFRSLIAKPFDQLLQNSNLSLTNTADSADQDLLGLRQKDTDQDGLSDYDELYIYQTSPYLEDSDSDGVKDQKEIASNSDPNCPRGQDCTVFYPEEQLVEVTAADGNVDVSQLRALLVSAGVSADILSGISDERLLQTYLKVTGGTVGATSTVQSSAAAQPSISVSIDHISQLTPIQLRQLLLEQGISAATLDQVSDEELLTLVQETLQGY